MRSIKQIKNSKGKVALVRVDFNVPVKNDMVEDDFRIRMALPTIQFLLKKGMKIFLITHLEKNGIEELYPVASHFFKISKFPKDRVFFFDNIRKFPGEKENDLEFAKELAKMGDIYVNEAFSVSHREHASIVTLPKYLPSYAGLGLEKEIKNLSRVFQKPQHPFLFILGGAKFSTKIPLLEKYLKLADYVFVGGALANYLLKAKGYKIGKSLVDEKKYDVSKILNSPKLILPADFVVKKEAIIDIGKKSTESLVQMIKKSRFILWNGPLGKYEDGGDRATKKIMDFLLKEKSKNIILGGGDLVSCMPKSKLKSLSSNPKTKLFISTGGGATLEFLTKGTLPGIKALK